MEARPPIAKVGSGSELKRWYWRKAELIAYARDLGVPVSGAKFALLDRIAHYLDTGSSEVSSLGKKTPSSRFDWRSAQLSPETKITDSYRNTQNVRAFFAAELGEAFRFNIAFMEWVKTNTGKTLKDACEAYREIEREASKPGSQTQIKRHNQFNQYVRDFLAANPDKSMSDARDYWSRKTQLPSETGRHVYEEVDLKLPKTRQQPGLE